MNTFLSYRSLHPGRKATKMTTIFFGLNPKLFRLYIHFIYTQQRTHFSLYVLLSLQIWLEKFIFMSLLSTGCQNDLIFSMSCFRLLKQTIQGR